VRGYAFLFLLLDYTHPEHQDNKGNVHQFTPELMKSVAYRNGQIYHRNYQTTFPDTFFLNPQSYPIDALIPELNMNVNKWKHLFSGYKVKTEVQ
jgi:hypothetical protein